MSDAGDDESLSAASHARFVEARRMIAEHARGLVLDIGCGHMPFRADVIAAGAEYRGLDREARVDGVDYIGDIQDLREIKTASIDTVMCFEVLEHVPDPARAMSELSRILKPGGVLLLTVPHLSRLHEEPHDYFRYTNHGLRTLCERSGLPGRKGTGVRGVRAVGRPSSLDGACRALVWTAGDRWRHSRDEPPRDQAAALARQDDRLASPVRAWLRARRSQEGRIERLELLGDRRPFVAAGAREPRVGEAPGERGCLEELADRRR